MSGSLRWRLLNEVLRTSNPRQTSRTSFPGTPLRCVLGFPLGMVSSILGAVSESFNFPNCPIMDTVRRKRSIKITGPLAVADGLHELLDKASLSANARVEEFVGY